MSDRVPEEMPERMSGQMPDTTPEKMSDRMSKYIPEPMSNRIRIYYALNASRWYVRNYVRLVSKSVDHSKKII